MGAFRIIAHVLAFALAATLAVGVPGSVVAQQLGRVQSPILTIDRDRLFSESAFGQRVNREIEATSNAMAAESRRIESDLEEEERQLTEKRKTMEPDAFRELAKAFDEKVQALRKDRDSAEANLRKQIEQAQADFFEKVGPILGTIVREHGAVLIVDRRAILLAAADVDITDEAIARIDAVLGDGTSEDAALPAPDTGPTSADPSAPLDSLPAPGNGDTLPPADTTAPAGNN